ncbi:Disease resistance protein [Quillaja saponaria]|uniref:Disease resistance protein n=1 Tax=Quillaja saponaria TaxID=32244 RepID=A0AAD7KVB3_QUISA|nr:Disease resistance protein [Quillaja saponaria]
MLSYDLIMKVDIHDDRTKRKAMKALSGLSAVSKLRKFCRAELLSIGPAKEPQKKDGPKKYEQNKLLDRSGMSTLYTKQAGMELTEPPKVEQWHGVVEIHLMDNNLCELPESPDCPQLKILFLQGNADLTMIPTLFFNHMPVLHVLDLSFTSIQDLPISFFKLVALREFLLRGCELFMELPPEIGQLKKLEKLDLDGTQITHLPIEIQELLNLKTLTLSFYEYDTGYDSIIPPGVLSNLQQLIELSIDVSPDDHRLGSHVEIIITEICELRNLKTLTLFIPKVDILKHIEENYLKQINSFSFVVGHHMKRIILRVPPEVETEIKRWDKSLKFVNGRNVPDKIKMVLKHAKAFFLDRHMTIPKLSEFGLENFRRLRWNNGYGTSGNCTFFYLYLSPCLCQCMSLLS